MEQKSTTTSANFADLLLSPKLLEAITKKGYQTPTPIQEGVIPLLLKGEKDIIGQAQTGTGKTAAFALPLLDLVDFKKPQPQALVLAPTRELALQVAREIESFAPSNTTVVVYGGNPISKELKLLKQNPTIIIGTPGRVQHHIKKGSISLDSINYFVLDEADEMLNFGFREDIEQILSHTPEQRRVLLFSATMPKSIMSIVENYMREYDLVKIKPKQMTNENIYQEYFCFKQRDRFDALSRIITKQENFYAIIFCRTKSEVDQINHKLAAKNFRVEAIHGDIEQAQREKVLHRFREKNTTILVATDVAARGIDIQDLEYVVNYGLPENPEIYAHRIGRTGRAGKKGHAITLINESEARRLQFFEKKLNQEFKQGTLGNAKECNSC